MKFVKFGDGAKKSNVNLFLAPFLEFGSLNFVFKFLLFP